jgi:hypothetical protein
MHPIAKRYIEHIQAYERQRQGPPSLASALYPRHPTSSAKVREPLPAVQGVSRAAQALYPNLVRERR